MSVHTQLPIAEGHGVAHGPLVSRVSPVMTIMSDDLMQCLMM